MIKHLLRILDHLGVTVSVHGNYEIVVSYFICFDEIKNTYIKVDTPEDEKILAGFDKIDFPIYSIDIDDSELKIYLTKGRIEENDKLDFKNFNYTDIYEKIKTLSRNYKSFEVVSTSRLNMIDSCEDKVDIPIVDVFLDKANNKICFIESTEY